MRSIAYGRAACLVAMFIAPVAHLRFGEVERYQELLLRPSSRRRSRRVRKTRPSPPACIGPTHQ
jgi:hypothetical protein